MLKCLNLKIDLRGKFRKTKNWPFFRGVRFFLADTVLVQIQLLMVRDATQILFKLLSLIDILMMFITNHVNVFDSVLGKKINGFRRYYYC